MKVEEMKSVVIGELLSDFRSIKLRKSKRAFIDQSRASLEANGSLSYETIGKLRELASNYSGQLKELHAARERARITNGLRRMGMTREQADKVRQERERSEEAMANDLGI